MLRHLVLNCTHLGTDNDTLFARPSAEKTKVWCSNQLKQVQPQCELFDDRHLIERFTACRQLRIARLEPAGLKHVGEDICIGIPGQ